jgi:hypothetical protein
MNPRPEFFQDGDFFCGRQIQKRARKITSRHPAIRFAVAPLHASMEGKRLEQWHAEN